MTKKKLTKGERLVKIVKQWVKENQVWCSESIYQTDRVQENLTELAHKVCDVVGYHKEDNDDD